VYQYNVRKVSRLCVIDDFCHREYDCDILINQNFFYNIDGYSEKVSGGCRFLVGPQYAILSDEYRDIHNQTVINKKPIHNVLIYFGGSDEVGMTLKTMSALSKTRHHSYLFTVIVGALNKNRDEIFSFQKNNHRFKALDHIDNFPLLLSGVDFMIGAGGTTQLERCCLGIPGIVISIAENQKRVSEMMMQAGAGYYLGWHENITEDDIQRCFERLTMMPELIHDMSQTAFNLVDGVGVERVESVLIDEPFILRSATIGDIKMVYDWRNHEETRRYSFKSDTINFHNHIEWFKQTLLGQKSKLLIAETEGSAFAVVRFDYEGEKAVISIYLSPNYIGRGLGSVLIRQSVTWFRRHHSDIAYLQAVIKEDNVRSIRAFTSAGFQKEGLFYMYKL
jgi:spore coat polysaccharide biosynthesis predicted glycosyltransferase SpsG/L-amino acid N-acyltransferase YncA